MVVAVYQKRKNRQIVSFNTIPNTVFQTWAVRNFIMMNTAQRLQFEEEIGLTMAVTFGPGWPTLQKS